MTKTEEKPFYQGIEIAREILKREGTGIKYTDLYRLVCIAVLGRKQGDIAEWRELVASDEFFMGVGFMWGSMHYGNEEKLGEMRLG